MHVVFFPFFKPLENKLPTRCPIALSTVVCIFRNKHSVTYLEITIQHYVNLIQIFASYPNNFLYRKKKMLDHKFQLFVTSLS